MNMLKKGPELKMPDLKVPDFLLDVYYDLASATCCPWSRSCSSPSSPCRSCSAAARAPTNPKPQSPRRAQPSPPASWSWPRRHPGCANTRSASRAAQGSLQAAVHRSRKAATAEGVARPRAAKNRATTIESSESSEPRPKRANAGTIAPPSEGNGEPPQAATCSTSPSRSTCASPRSPPKKEAGSHRAPRPARHDDAAQPGGTGPHLRRRHQGPEERGDARLRQGHRPLRRRHCIEGTERCQLIALEPGIPETVVYGADSRTYRIELLKLRLLKTDKLNVAPLGPRRRRAAGAPNSAISSW